MLQVCDIFDVQVVSPVITAQQKSLMNGHLKAANRDLEMLINDSTVTVPPE